jgi:YihY family inner membrane protein
MLSLVPFLTLTVAAFSLFFEEQQILDILRPELRQIIPQHADTILLTVQTFLQNPGAISAVSVLVLLVFSAIAFRMLEESVAGIFHTSARGARRSFWVSALMPYLFILLMITALFFVTLLISGLDALVVGHSLRISRVTISLEFTSRLFLRLVSFLGLVLLFTGVYHVLPVMKVSLRRAFIGGFCAAVLWRLVGLLMVYYFTNISMLDLIYGSLATIIVVLLFLETAVIILLLGAQVIAELEASAAAGRPWYEKPPEH